jgi:hypothetical protein
MRDKGQQNVTPQPSKHHSFNNQASNPATAAPKAALSEAAHAAQRQLHYRVVAEKGQQLTKHTHTD